MSEQVGVYISVPFCKAKCTYCNFASGVFGAERMGRYVERVCREIAGVRAAAAGLAATLPRKVDTIFLGGGTPSLLSSEQMHQLFTAVRAEFDVSNRAEITLECAPGQLGAETLDEMLRLGMNRISFGVQSFIDAEAKAAGRLHNRAMCLAEIERMRAAGMREINVDLIAGLPGQTAESWRESVEVAIATGVPHVSVYMLEVDEDSRLGREMIAAGSRYGASGAPSEDETAEWYSAACQWLESAGIKQYEISNFAREGHASKHNIKYWRREPYVGFGLDAHSMLRKGEAALRWANTSDLDDYLAGDSEDIFGLHKAWPEVDLIGREQSFEETMFLGLRMNEGVSMSTLHAEFGAELVRNVLDVLTEVEDAGLVEVDEERIRLTTNGRMASNEVFGRLLVAAV